MADKAPNFHFLATGIGSVPFQDIERTCVEILERLPEIPFWPQFVKRSPLEDMALQFSEGLPLLEINEEKRSIAIPSLKDAERALVTFYDHFFANDFDYFKISRHHAPGLYTLPEMIEKKAISKPPYIKGQTVGPITFSAAVRDPDGNSILHNPELLEAMVRGIAIKALWQIRELGKWGERPIIFLDEPYLSGFGSAFSSLQRHDVIEILRSTINYVKEKADSQIGIHCCGNTDWSMLLAAGPDIINFDAYEYMDYFLLYPKDILRFIEGGGTVAWGIIPTAGFTQKEEMKGLLSKLREGLHRVSQWGVSPEILAERSMITPACGMGTMSAEAARMCLALLSSLSRELRTFP